MKKARYSNLLKAIKPGQVYTLSALYALVQKCYPQYRISGCHWVVYHLLEAKQLQRIGTGLYIRTSRRPFLAPSLSKQSSKTLSVLQKSFPHLTLVAFETSLLNEWLNELLAHSTLVIEVKSQALEDVYFLLKEKLGNRVLLKPSEKEMSHYRTAETLILEPLSSRAPLSKKAPSIGLEKLMVDLLADHFFSFFLSESELPSLYQKMTKDYLINYNTLHAYAQRRGVENRLKRLLPKDLPERK